VFEGVILLIIISSLDQINIINYNWLIYLIGCK
jgi:hypothetical protein